MSEAHACGGCGCGGHKTDAPKALSLHALSSVKHVIAIASGSGGSGKTQVCAQLANALQSDGARVGILDADIANPSIPLFFDLPQGVTRSTEGIYPALSEGGIQIISATLFLEDESELITTQGATMAGIVGQFFSDTIWSDLDYLLIDIGGGISDLSAFVLERIPLRGMLAVHPNNARSPLPATRLHGLAQTHGTQVLADLSTDLTKTPVLTSNDLTQCLDILQTL